MKINKSRLAKAKSQGPPKRSRDNDSAYDRSLFAERFLSYMDYTSILFSLEDTSYCVKFVSNSPDAPSVDPPYCCESIDYDNNEENLKLFFGSSLSPKQYENDKSIKKYVTVKKPLGTLQSNKSLSSNFIKHTNGYLQYDPQCVCKRRVIYVQNMKFNPDSVEYMNLVDCVNGFVNETPFCICEPSSSNYFIQGTNYANPKGEKDNCNFAFYAQFRETALKDHIDKIYQLSIFKDDTNLNSGNLSGDQLLAKYEMMAPSPPKKFQLDHINAQYLGFFEFCSSGDSSINQRRLFHHIDADLIHWDTEHKRRSLSVDSDDISFLNDRNDTVIFCDSGQNSNKLVGNAGKSKITKISLRQCENIYRNRLHTTSNMPSEKDLDPDLQRTFCFEHVNYSCLLYRLDYYGRPHHTFLIDDPDYGPIIISILSETTGERKLPPSPLNRTFSGDINSNTVHRGKRGDSQHPSSGGYHYEMMMKKQESIDTPLYLKHSIIVRTVTSISLKATLYEGFPKNVSIKKFLAPESNHNVDVINYVLPNLDLSHARVVTGSLKLEDQIIKFDETDLSKKFKCGILYCGNKQSTESEIYNNRDGSFYFKEFLQLIGSKVNLKGFSTKENPKYYAQLDVVNDRTGKHSIYTKFFGREIMFHVSTMIPFNETNPQQIDRKRHIGNDIVIVVFQEAGALPLSPDTFQTQFTHVVICVRHTKTGEYFVSVSRKRDVPYFGPPIASSYTKNELFREFLLTKIINAEMAALKSKKFYMMAMRTRFQSLKDIVTTYSERSSHTSGKEPAVHSNGTSLSSISSLKPVNYQRRIQKIKSVVKKFKVYENLFPLSPELFAYSGVGWNVGIRSGDNIVTTKCKMIIANQVIMFVDIFRREPIVTIEFSNIFFWKSTDNKRIDIYYKPKNILMVLCDESSIGEFPYILCRLRFFLKNIDTEVVEFRRYPNILNDIHINRKGIITNVNNKCILYFNGLRNDTHIIEIDKIPLMYLTYKQFMGLLKDCSKTDLISLTVISGIGVEKRLISCDIQSTSSNIDGINIIVENQVSPISSSVVSPVSTHVATPVSTHVASPIVSYMANPITNPIARYGSEKNITSDMNAVFTSSKPQSIDAEDTSHRTKVSCNRNLLDISKDQMNDSDIDYIFNELEKTLSITQSDSEENWTYIKNKSQRPCTTSSRSRKSDLSKLVESGSEFNPKPHSIYQSKYGSNIQNANKNKTSQSGPHEYDPYKKTGNL